jgi:hypothetical protein
MDRHYLAIFMPILSSKRQDAYKITEFATKSGWFWNKQGENPVKSPVFPSALRRLFPKLKLPRMIFDKTYENVFSVSENIQICMKRR